MQTLGVGIERGESGDRASSLRDDQILAVLDAVQIATEVVLELPDPDFG